MDIQVTPIGIGEEALQAAGAAAMQLPPVRSLLNGTKHRLLSLRPLFAPAPGAPLLQDRFRATIYDYTNNRTVIIEGPLTQPAHAEVTTSDLQPLSSNDEFEEAVSVARRHTELGPEIESGRLVPYRPMPPILSDLPDGRQERAITVGLMPSEGSAGHEIVAVSIRREEVIRFDGRAPAGAEAHNPICGLKGIWQSTTPWGTPGQAAITISDGPTPLWSFVIVRPSASSGGMGSGIDLLNVTYKGKLVLTQAHLPILNVLYDGNVCGPYRDWQNEEGAFKAAGTDIASGIRSCPTPATTIIDSGQDRGDFRGVAVYEQGTEVALVSELEAGWYRYVSEWRFDADGTIRPRWGFSAVKNSCVCTVHHHHAYWRFDFAIGTAQGNSVQEFNNPPEVPGVNWQPLLHEAKRMRDPSKQRKWRVERMITGEGYELRPGPEDGTADAYGQGDVWILRHHPGEIDDGWTWQQGTEAHLDKFANSEQVEGQDVVIWYGAHFSHHPDEETGFGHRVGPDLVPHNWG